MYSITQSGQCLRHLLRDEEGAQVVEYALIIAVVSIALVLAIQGLAGGKTVIIASARRPAVMNEATTVRPDSMIVTGAPVVAGATPRTASMAAWVSRSIAGQSGAATNLRATATSSGE